MDGPEEIGGADAATRPLELFLMGLAGCSGMDVISILTKMRVPLSDFRMEVSAPRVEEYPQVFKKIEIVYHIHGDVSDKQAERAVNLSHEKFCSASAMLKPAVPIEHQIIIHRDEEALAEGGTVKEST
jgi:putative redox protein